MSLLNIRDDREAQRLDRKKRQPDRRWVRGEGRGRRHRLRIALRSAE